MHPPCALGYGVVLASLLAGCGPGGGPSSRQGHYRAFSQKFGEAILAKNFTAAYPMMSRLYRARADEAAFVAFFKKVHASYGKATRVAVGMNTVEADGPLGEGLGFPPEVPVKDRRARMAVRMYKGPSDANDCIYEVWINVVHEDGQDRIVTVEIPGINM